MKDFKQSLLFFAAFVAGVWYHISEVDSANCAGYSSESDCDDQNGCAWDDSRSTPCYCTSNVTMDICFALDASGSVGSTYFDIELLWLSDFVQSSLSASARVGIVEFSTESEMILNFTDSESMSTSDLAQFIEDISYWTGFTNTVQAIKQGIVMFEKQSLDETTKVFVILTDGNPKMPNGGDTDVCAWASTLKADDINTYILGVGSNWNPDNVDCLVSDTDNDILYVTSFNYSEFNKILPALTEVTCPESYEVVITEVKVESDGQDGRTVPFVEIYNPSNEITLSELTFSGVVSGVPTSDTSRTLPQGYYLVLYDTTYSGGGDNVTCLECDCTKRGTDYCTKSIYIGCDDSDCTFLSSYTNTNWYVKVEDNTITSGSSELDTVTWDSTYPDLSSLVGYSYELKNKGFDNDDGSNWQASCNIYGSPGSEPLDSCTGTCSLSQCQAGGASNVDVDGDECDCSGENHYYADGCSCNLVPPPGDCYVYWRKNATNQGIDVDYKFIWGAADTDDDKQYYLSYYVSGSIQSVTLYPRYKVVTDYDTSRGVDATAGYVQTLQQGTLSQRSNCTSITQAPTTEPTPAPTPSPTPAPSESPTQSPTFENPYLYLAGDICDKERCECYQSSRDCTGDPVYTKWSEGSTKYVTVKQLPKDFPDTTTIYWDIEFLGQTETDNETQVENDRDDDTSRRLLSNDMNDVVDRRKRAMRRILENRYGKEVALNEINYLSQGANAKQSVYGSTVEPSTTVLDASTDITPISGYLNISYSDLDDTNEAKIELEVLEDGTDSDSDYELFRLELVNCSVESDIYEECDIVYPYRLYIILENTDSALTTVNTNEEEMPAWLWWVIVALVIFLFVLAWLVYRYWWKNKQTNSALAETQDELDQAIEEADLGFGRDLGQGDVGFNPLATGVPGSQRPTDAMGAELQNRQNMFGNDKADVAVERFNQKEQFGQVAPHRREKGGNDLAQPFL